MDNTILVVLVDIVIAIIILVGLYTFVKRYRNKKRADEIIADIQTRFYSIAVFAINGLNPKEFKNFDDYREIVLNAISREAWDSIDNEINKLIDEGGISDSILRYINRDKIDEIVKYMITKFNLEDRIQKTYIESRKDDIENENPMDELEFTDKDGNPIDVTDPENFNVDDDIEDPELEPAEEIVIPEAELAKLIPKVDEDTEAPQVTEDLTPEEIEAGVHYDSKGRKRRADGKFTK